MVVNYYYYELIVINNRVGYICYEVRSRVRSIYYNSRIV